MADTPREKLQRKLEEFAPNVYFQPPSNVNLQYPCIVYNKEAMEGNHANNNFYTLRQPYQVTVIDRDPESKIATEILRSIRPSNSVREFTQDNLHHSVLRLHTNI